MALIRQSFVENIDEMDSEVFQNLADMQIIVCGSPRVGKSTLINAICGRELAESRPGLNSVTKSIHPYSVESDCQIGSRNIHYKYTFWDTPGFESWETNDIRSRIKKIIRSPGNKPVCMIFCASPGTFVDLSQLEWLLNYCIKENNIFCALVCTNRYAGEAESHDAVINDFKNLLSRYTDQPPRENEEKNVTHYGKIGICASVNSKPYKVANIDFPPSGVNELIHGILESLVDEEVFKWIFVVLKNKGFWDQSKKQVVKFFKSMKNRLFGKRKK